MKMKMSTERPTQQPSVKNISNSASLTSNLIHFSPRYLLQLLDNLGKIMTRAILRLISINILLVTNVIPHLLTFAVPLPLAKPSKNH